MSKPRTHLPISKAIIWIFFSTLLVSGTATLGWFYHLHVKKKQVEDERYLITSIIQKGTPEPILSVEYLAETLGLSSDQPTNLYNFSLEKARKTLLKSPVIKEVSLKRLKPSTLYINYEVRDPIAYLSDYKNMAIDKEGIIFPVIPFYTPKKIPELFLGIESFEWNQPVEKKKLLLFKKTIDLFSKLAEKHKLKFKAIDLSSADKEAYGQREIRVTLEKEDKTEFLLRLHSEKYEEVIDNFVTLKQHLENRLEGKIVLDFRIPDIAFIEEQKND